MSPESHEQKQDGNLHTAVAVLSEQMKSLTTNVAMQMKLLTDTMGLELKQLGQRVAETQTSQHDLSRQMVTMQAGVAAEMKSLSSLVDGKIGEIDKKFDAKVERVIWAVAKTGGLLSLVVALIIFILNKWPIIK